MNHSEYTTGQSFNICIIYKYISFLNEWKKKYYIKKSKQNKIKTIKKKLIKTKNIKKPLKTKLLKLLLKMKS